MRPAALAGVLHVIGHLVALLRREHPAAVHTTPPRAAPLGRVAAEPARVPARVHTFHGHLLHGYFRAWTASAVVAGRRRPSAPAREAARQPASGPRIGTADATHVKPVGLKMRQNPGCNVPSPRRSAVNTGPG